MDWFPRPEPALSRACCAGPDLYSPIGKFQVAGRISRSIVFADLLQVPHTRLSRYANENHGFELVTFPMFSLTRARVAVSATFAMVGGQNDPPSNSKTKKDRRPGDTAIDSS